jgi:molybdopterin synthase catalytic subunit
VVTLVREAIALGPLQETAAHDGALALFLGVVRNEHAGRSVLHLEYEAYESMALSEMQAIEREARRRWPITEIRIVHRLGRMEIGETSVAVAVASPHRREAFEACRFAIDTLKKTVPIWKKEFYADGAVWLDGPGACDHEREAGS